jgi:hypothetical protein
MNSTDARIGEVRKLRLAVNEARERAAARERADYNQQATDLVAISKKWADAHTIQSALDDLQTKLKPEGARFGWRHQSGGLSATLGQAEFYCGQHEMKLRIFPTGEANVYFDGRDASTGFDLMSADQATYENLLLDLFELSFS